MQDDPDHAVFAALGNVTRLTIVQLLAASGKAGLIPSELADAVGVPRNLLGAHLLVLEKAALVQAEKRGRNRICRLDPAMLRAVARVVEALAGQAEGTGAT